MINCLKSSVYLLGHPLNFPAVAGLFLTEYTPTWMPPASEADAKTDPTATSGHVDALLI